jgi:hypothetical protein
MNEASMRRHPPLLRATDAALPRFVMPLVVPHRLPDLVLMRA